MSTVTLEITVDTTDATAQQQRLYEEMASLFEDRFALFVNKNIDYGSSFLTAGEVDMALDDGSGPFDDMMEANLYKLFTRIQDKNQRFYHQMFCDGGDHVGEDIAETAGDAMVYWAMVAWCVGDHSNG